MLEETERMTAACRALFYALVVHKKMKNNDPDTAALSFSMTIHSLIDRQMDLMTAEKKTLSGSAGLPEDIRKYIKWFSALLREDEDE